MHSFLGKDLFEHLSKGLQLLIKEAIDEFLAGDSADAFLGVIMDEVFYDLESLGETHLLLTIL